jgi:hypothetical protein
MYKAIQSSILLVAVDMYLIVDTALSLAFDASRSYSHGPRKRSAGRTFWNSKSVIPRKSCS